MSRLYLVADDGEIARRRRLLPPGQVVEAWPDLYTPGRVWMGAGVRALLETAGGPLGVLLSVDGAHVPIYYGPRLRDIGSLPTEDSLRARVLSGHGLAAAWVTPEQLGGAAGGRGESPLDPVFFLRRPLGGVAHRWRLFPTRADAVAYMSEFHEDPEAQAWAQDLPVESFPELLGRLATTEENPAG